MRQAGGLETGCLFPPRPARREGCPGLRGHRLRGCLTRVTTVFLLIPRKLRSKAPSPCYVSLRNLRRATFIEYVHNEFVGSDTFSHALNDILQMPGVVTHGRKYNGDAQIGTNERVVIFK